mgnify:CR=1 FL=1
MATELDKLVVKIEADLKGLKRDMAQANKVVSNSSKKMSGGFNKLSKSLAKVTATATKVGAVLGVGIARGLASLNMRVINRIFLSWIITLPAGALMSILFFFALKGIFGA